MGPLQPLFDGCPGKFPCIYLIVAFFYFVLAGLACRDLRRRLEYEWWTKYNVFIFLTFIFCFIRGLTLFIWPAMQKADKELAWIAIFDIPNLLYALTYTWLLLIWAEFTWGVAPRRVRILKHCSPRLMFALFNSLFFLGTPMLWVVSGHVGSTTLGKSLSMLLHLIMNLIVGIGFVLFGLPFRKKVLRLMRRYPMENEEYVKKKVRQTAWVILAALLSFVGNAALQVVSGRAAKKLDWTQNIILYLIIFVKELMVISSMQWMFDGVPPKADKIVVPPPPPPKEPKETEESEETGEEKEAEKTEGNVVQKEGETTVLIQSNKPPKVPRTKPDGDSNPPQGIQMMPINK